MHLVITHQPRETKRVNIMGHYETVNTFSKDLALSYTYIHIFVKLKIFICERLLIPRCILQGVFLNSSEIHTHIIQILLELVQLAGNNLQSKQDQFRVIRLMGK